MARTTSASTPGTPFALSITNLTRTPFTVSSSTSTKFLFNVNNSDLTTILQPKSTRSFDSLLTTSTPRWMKKRSNKSQSNQPIFHLTPEQQLQSQSFGIILPSSLLSLSPNSFFKGGHKIRRCHLLPSTPSSDDDNDSIQDDWSLIDNSSIASNNDITSSNNQNNHNNNWDPNSHYHVLAFRSNLNSNSKLGLGSGSILNLTILPNRSTQTWMTDLPSEVNPKGDGDLRTWDERRVSELVIGGTHDSCAMYGYPVAQCQESRSIEKQLQDGIRAFDIRLAVKSHHSHYHLVAYHGLQSQVLKAEAVFHQIFAFLEENPRETVICSVKQEDTEFGPNVFEKVFFERVVNGDSYDKEKGEKRDQMKAGRTEKDESQLYGRIAQGKKKKFQLFGLGRKAKGTTVQPQGRESSPSTRSTDSDRTAIGSITSNEYSEKPAELTTETQTNQNNDGNGRFWYLGREVPTLKEARGKVILFSRFGDPEGGNQNDLGLHPPIWPDNPSKPFSYDMGGQEVVCQDWYNIGTFLSIPEKYKRVQHMFESYPHPEPWSFNFSSGSAFVTAFPIVVAKGFGYRCLGFEGVNSRLLKYLAKAQKGKEGGKEVRFGGCVVLMDFYHFPEEMLVRTLMEFNY